VTGGSTTVLLVEHQPAFRSHVLSSPDAEGAQALLREHKGSVDLLLTDFAMPGISGHELGRMAEAQRPGIKVLYLSGNPEEMVWTPGFLKQRPAWLAKPFSSQMLAAAVRKALNLQRVIVIVDGDEEVRAFLREPLQSNGYEVREAASLRIAREILSGNRIDLVIGDLANFKQSGGDSVRNLRRLHPSTAILTLTGNYPAVSKNPPFVRRRSRRAVETEDLKARWLRGADAALPKPVSIDLLLETLNALFRE
jgi:DNA-binding response OmpR family regulator